MTVTDLSAQFEKISEKRKPRHGVIGVYAGDQRAGGAAGCELRDALDSMGTLFAHLGDDSQRQLSSKLSSNGSE